MPLFVGNWEGKSEKHEGGMGCGVEREVGLGCLLLVSEPDRRETR